MIVLWKAIDKASQIVRLFVEVYNSWAYNHCMSYILIRASVINAIHTLAANSGAAEYFSIATWIEQFNPSAIDIQLT